MKRYFVILLTVVFIVALALSLTACNNNLSTDKLLVNGWSNTYTETLTYDIRTGSDSGNIVGSLTMQTVPDANGYTININQTMLNGDTVTAYVKFNGSGTAGAVFPPTESVKTIFTNANGKTVTQKCVYNGGKVTYYTADAAEIAADAVGTEYAITSPYYDNMQFYTILRGATYDNKFSLAFKVFIPNENAVSTLTCSLVSATDITFKFNGEDTKVSCQPIAIARDDSKGQSYYSYYATSDLAVGDKVLKKALVRFIEGSYYYTLTEATIA